MKKIFSVVIGIVVSFTLFGQLSGDVFNQGRKLTQSGSYILESHTTGKLVFAISVDASGEITSIKSIDKEGTIKSTPAKIKARNYISENFKFEPGTWFPKYHQGKITITLVEPK
ncbi:MAG TPA: hypothetical protein VL021_10015 [Brumimicrobium sp.]|nr:hypothetical protein [Brumimicrobium sp.]